jgi:hypothetical protein
MGIHDENTTALFKEDRTTDEETMRESILEELGNVWIGSVDHRKRRAEAFETWCSRRMMKIKRTDKIRHEGENRRIDEERTLWNTIVKKRTRWIGHTF